MSTGLAFTPHDRAQFLAASAPGSRNMSRVNTPYTSRPVSPTQRHGSRDTLRPVSSTSRLTALLMEEGIRRAFTPLEEVAEGTASRLDDSDMKEEPEANLLAESIHSDEMDAFRTYSHGLPTQSDSTTITTPQDVVPPPSSWSRNKPVGAGRPRRASMALNEAYNAANPSTHSVLTSSNTQNTDSFGHSRSYITSSTQHGNLIPSRDIVAEQWTGKCPLHGEECDGVTVTGTWQTQAAIEGRGFADLYPVIVGAGGRRMVDWEGLLRQERVNRGREEWSG
ncbi:hypothetical protein P153DRAFT_363602 [Dothidotthia symphoricarpi CBS 119687]|uniref:Uncharacterized protein n=1 Tax=Dothidotthia symphoricarpi CBS 119687 TaxID=1392245 RepID=A0A6A6AQX8_9PLEO|nr:uncharacterized protein P153DRAFT_363602 [Dothidotthia symphoricarpi CBS 119687]KAF2133405.1 hypothetical protein P153DRAFT_363602 [Dothidotthia symphoricarpi CBS 119687]